MKWLETKRRSSVLGLTLDGGQLRACHLERSKGGVEVRKTFAVPLELDLLTQDVELVGQELRNHLDGAGIRERHCVVALPASWIMGMHCRLPDLPPEDVASFLQLEAERSFPCGLDELQVVQSTQKAGGVTFATQLGVRLGQLDRLSAVLKAAQLKPRSYTMGLAATPGVLVPEGEGLMTLALDNSGATLLVAAGGGVVAMRTCEAFIEGEAGERVVHAATVGRELRITLEQVPAELRPELRRLKLVGDEGLVRDVAEGLAAWAQRSGVRLEPNAQADGQFSQQIAQNIAQTWLEGGRMAWEFLPPRPSRWQQLRARYDSRRLTTVGAIVGVAAAVVAVAFGWLEFRAWSLRSEWAAIKPQVTSLETLQTRIRDYRSWYDTTCRNLGILARVTEAFPEFGTVNAKTFEIRSQSVVSITGVTRDNTALLKTLDQLRQMKEIRDVKVEQIRGKSPSQFTFNFRWSGDTAP